MGVAQDRLHHGLHNHAGETISSSVHRSKTEDLSAWINQVKTKKTVICRRRRSDYRLRAMLSNALYKAENELKTKQQERYKKWQLIKLELFGDNECKDSDFSYNNVNSSEDFDSLNMFMSKVSEIKRNLER
jgi:hypothetical protein